MEELQGAPKMQIITICVDAEEVRPKIDLGNIHPFIAYAIVSKALEALGEIMADPEVTYLGEVMNPSYYEYISEEDDDDE